MGDIFFTGAENDGSLATAGNYSGGALPTGVDRLFFNARGGSNSVTAGLDALDAVDGLEVFILEGYMGNLGGSGVPVETGPNWTIHNERYTGNHAAYFEPKAGTVAIAKRTCSNADCFTIENGIMDAAYAVGYDGLSRIRFNGTPTVATVQASGPMAFADVMNVGAVLTNMRGYDGSTIYSKSKANNAEFVDANLKWDNDTDLVWALFEMFGARANVELMGKGKTTFTNYKQKGGLLHRGHKQSPVVFTAGEIHAGAMLLGKSGPVETTAAFDVYGGVIDAPNTFNANEIIGEYSSGGKSGGYG